MRSLLLLLALLLAACPTSGRGGANDDDAVDDDDSADDSVVLDVGALDGEGPYPASSTSFGFATSTGCTLDYTLHTPDDGADAPLVLLLHGFQRAGANMVDLGDHLASWGLRVAVPDLCHSTFTDSDPEANAAEVIELALDLAPTGAVAYVGYSAGGLAALIAASEDPRAAVFVGLDAVDNGPGPAAAAAITAPVYGIFGEPSSCNASSNGVAVLQGASDASLGRVTEADHCDFEAPTDGLCTGLCEGTNDQFDDATLRGTVRALMTAPLLVHLAEEDAAETWWSGDEAAALQAQGLWTPL